MKQALNVSTLVIHTILPAPPAVCFDLARDVDLHQQTAGKTQERAVEGVTTGLMGEGDSVTFEGVHFGVRQRFTARITVFQPPTRFVDEMTRGAFKSMRHIHEFKALGDGTLMTDTLIWTSPFGWLGVLADKLLVERHMRNFLEARNSQLQMEALERSP